MWAEGIGRDVAAVISQQSTALVSEACIDALTDLSSALAMSLAAMGIASWGMQGCDATWAA